MKKFFRVALVCALAGATLLYTGCTKDYSEDLNTLQKKVDAQGNSITSLDEQVRALLAAKASLEEADKQATAAINSLKDRATNLEKEVDTLKSEKTRLENLIKKNAGDIADLKDSLSKVDSLIGVINGQISTINGEIDTLKNTVKAHESALDSLGKELAKKADKTYVDAELAKKADKSWVEETLKNYATVKELTDTAAALRAELMKINKEIFDIKNDLSELHSGLTALGTRLNRVADSVAVNAADIKTINQTIASMQSDIDTLQSDMSKAKEDIVTAQNTADKGVRDAASAMAFARQVKSFVEDNYYKKSVVDDLVGQKADTAIVNPKFRAIDARFEEVVEAYEKADSLLDVKIDSLDAAINELLGTKVDTTTFKEAIQKIWDEFAAVEKNIDKLLARVQSIVYVPDYDDNRITFNWAYMGDRNKSFDVRKATLPASFDDEAWEEFEENLDDDYEKDWTAYVEPTHIKYRFYGEDPEGTAESIAAAVNEGKNILAFDVVSVLTRANADEVAVKIVSAKATGDVIDLTVIPENIPNEFWMWTWDAKNTMNPETHWEYFDKWQSYYEWYCSTKVYNWLYKQAWGYSPDDVKALEKAPEEPTANVKDEYEFPSYSISLVLTDPEASRLITSAYNNIVPSDDPSYIELLIYKDGKDVSWEDVDDLKIEYNDLEEHNLLAGTELRYAYNDEVLTQAEFDKLGIVTGEPVVRFFAEKDYSGAINPASLPEDYIHNASEDKIPAVDVVTLTKNTPDGVGAEEAVVLQYYVGDAYVECYGSVEVVPIQVKLNIDFHESETVEAFTWEYNKDAAVDAAIFNGEDDFDLYKREGAVASFDPVAVATELAKAGIGIDYFANAFPTCVDSAKTVFTFKYVAADGTETKKEVKISDDPDFQFEPYVANGALKADVSEFNFFDPEMGVLTEISYVFVFDLPNKVQPAVVATITGKIAVDDRDRTPIVITLPTLEKDIEHNMYVEANDVLYDGADLAEGVTVVTSFADHHLVKADVADAFDQVTSRSWGVGQVNNPTTTTYVLYAKNFAYNGQAGYQQNERIDSLTMTIDDEIVKDLARNNTTVHTETEYLSDEDAAVKFRTTFKVTALDLSNKFLGPNADYESYLTLWYGQDVIVKKSFAFNNDGIFDYERIPEYVTYNSDEDVFTTLQPLWQPDGATTDFTIPVTSYDANRVLLNQHFRIRDVLNDVVATDLKGVIKDEYSYLRRRFWLENAEGEKVTSIADPRGINDWAVTIDNALTANTGLNEEPNELYYYSKAEKTDVYGDLYLFNDNGSFFVLKTRFDRKAGDETYENYVIKLYDPLQKELKVKNDNEKQLVNVNNSTMTYTSIYEFLSLKDKRGFELIDGTIPEGSSIPNTWVKGDGTNGFDASTTADQVYSLSFTHKMQYLTTVSDETKERIQFNEETGVLTYDNRLHTQLNAPIDIKLSINVEYPWGTRSQEVVVEFYNTPVGE